MGKTSSLLNSEAPAVCGVHGDDEAEEREDAGRATIRIENMVGNNHLQPTRPGMSPSHTPNHSRGLDIYTKNTEPLSSVRDSIFSSNLIPTHHHVGNKLHLHQTQMSFWICSPFLDQSSSFFRYFFMTEATSSPSLPSASSLSP